MMAREAWTDERLDDLNSKVDDGFARMEARFDKVDERFENMDARWDARFARMEQRFDSLQHTLIGGAAVIVAALLGIIATQL